MSATHTPPAQSAGANFFDERMRQLGITAEINRIDIFDPEAEFPQPEYQVWPLFAEDKTSGDILISYYTIDAEPIRYLQQGDGKTSYLNAKTKYYETRRLKEPKGDMKYQMPSGQPTNPWFPPALVDKFKRKEQVPTLILTEGVFKAMCGSMAGLDVVGLPSVTCYSDRDTKRLYRDVERLIEACNVQNLVVLWDGDCLNISRKDLQVGEELTNRPAMFFNSAKKILELAHKIEYAKTREKVNVWFAHVKSDSLPARPKGLDDLIIAAQPESKAPRVVEELAEIDKVDKPFFFKTINITGGTGTLWKYFRLNKAEDFYSFHAQTIGSAEFKFRGSTYKWSEVNNELEMQAPEWANRVKWVGDEFFLEDVVPGAVRDRRKLISYSQGQFTKMFGKDFWTYLQHHRAFVNIPNHFKYQQVVETNDGAKYYNRYFPYPHVPAEGTWANILSMLKHIFGTHQVEHGVTGQKINAWELGLDYIQLLLTVPTQMLPVLCLYSPENNTGKSTLGKFLMHMFGDNAVPISNKDLESEFNETFVDKLLAICDETLLERRRDAERIKAMSTSDQIMVNPKGQKQYGIDYFCKFIFTSNNLRMLYVSKHDQRYWIIRVPVLTADNPTILDDMKAEIPAFTHYLTSRKLVTERESRMWFHPSLIKTPIFNDMVRVNEPTEASNLREQLREWFIMDSELTEIRMTLKEIRAEFFSDRASAPWVQEILRDHIGVDLLRDAAGEAVFERGQYFKYVADYVEGVEDYKRVAKPYRGRPYVFRRDQFLAEGDVRYQPSDSTTAQTAAAAPSHPAVIQTAMSLGDTPF